MTKDQQELVNNISALFNDYKQLNPDDQVYCIISLNNHKDIYMLPSKKEEDE